LDTSQIPFAAADESRGWLSLGSQPPGPGADVTTDLCAAAENDLAAERDATVTSHAFHGTPTNTPVYAGSNYLYSSADQSIATFPTADRAAAGFDHAKQVTGEHGCTFTDTAGRKVTRTIKAGAVSATGFSIQIDDSQGPSHDHVYYVLKGNHVSRLFVNFERSDGATADDAAVLAAIEARLP
jgi:hypothetical protein